MTEECEENGKFMLCPICNNAGKRIFEGKIMRKYTIQYYQCPVCAFVYTERPYWLQEAYEDSITNVDTGIMQRNVDNVIIANALIKNFFDRNGTFLDYGGGYGIFTRMMRDLGYNYMWHDKYSENLVARGFEFEGCGNVELLSAFELFEHFEKPLDEIRHLFSMSKSILFSTLIYAEDFKYKKFDDWWYYVPETGQHIGFFSRKTLEYMAGRFKVHYYKINNGLHLYSDHYINPLRFKAVARSPLKYLDYYISRRNGLAVKDMETVLKQRQS